MTNVARGQDLSSRNWLDGFTDENAVHYDWGAGSQVADGKLVLGGNVGFEKMLRSHAVDELPLLQIGEGDYDIVTGIELYGPRIQS